MKLKYDYIVLYNMSLVILYIYITHIIIIITSTSKIYSKIIVKYIIKNVL